MIEPHVLDAWLNSTNARYRAEEVPPRQRPFRALSDFSREFKYAFLIDSPIANSITDWFYKNSAPGAHAIGSRFTGAYFFDAYFWPLHIPIGYGSRLPIDVFDCLKTMPQPVKELVHQSPQDLWNLVLYWADCIDYGYGIDDIRKLGKFNEKALTFINNGDQELTGAIAQLILPRPNLKAILALRLACEIFLKALLIQERNLTDDSQLKKLSHKIEGIAAECFEETNIPEFDVVRNSADVFPPVSDRYDGTERKLSEVWDALCVTQIAATAVIRRYTDRDMRPQIFAERKDGS
jgi:hypothetical protein